MGGRGFGGFRPCPVPAPAPARGRGVDGGVDGGGAFTTVDADGGGVVALAAALGAALAITVGGVGATGGSTEICAEPAVGAGACVAGRKNAA